MPEPERDDSPAERLFFALWPDDALRQQLMQCRDTLVADSDGGRRVPAENLHLTLAFLGRTDIRQRACVEAMADVVQCPPFELQLNRSGYWPRPRVLWIAPVEMPEALITLATDLHAGTEGCGLKLDARAYRAHITLMRKLAHPPQNAICSSLTWSVGRFVLVRSRTLPQGVEYEVLREWGLGEELFEG